MVNRTIKVKSRKIIFKRNLNSEYEFLKWPDKRFTGFKVQWNCTNCYNEGNKRQFKNKDGNKYFVLIANIIMKGTPLEKVWKAMKSTKNELKIKINEIFYDKWTDTKYFDYDLKRRVSLYESFFVTFEKNLQALITDFTIYENITDETLTSAANIFLYMTAPHQKYWIEAFGLYSHWLEYLSPRVILGRYIILYYTKSIGHYLCI